MLHNEIRATLHNVITILHNVTRILHRVIQTTPHRVMKKKKGYKKCYTDTKSATQRQRGLHRDMEKGIGDKKGTGDKKEC